MLLCNIYSVHINTVLEPPLFFADLYIISTHLALPHQPILRKSPILEAISAPPLSSLIVPLIPELHCNLIVCESKELLSQAIAILSLPFIREKLLNLVTALQESVTVTPDGIRSVRQFDAGWVSLTSGKQTQVVIRDDM